MRPGLPLSVYAHLPWCVRKCPYCDFNSHRAPDALPERDYIDALLADLRFETGRLQGRSASSLFIGGGTPSLFSAAEIGRLLDGVDATIGLAGDAEITLEANPGAIDAAHFAGYRAAGVNRLSIGAQSFRDDRLRALGRVHDARAARRAIALARAAGFASVNIDVMYALPDDDVGGAMADLDTAIALEPGHVSWYQLTIEPDTQFAQRPPALPADDAVIDIETAGHARLAAAGFQRYEVSAWARDGHASLHNLNYWRFGDYLGVGAGAHGKLTTGDGVVRTRKRRSPTGYMRVAGSADAVDESETPAAATLIGEFMMNALRLPAGFEFALFEARTGLGREVIMAEIDAAAADGLLLRNEIRAWPTARGFRYLDQLVLRFIG